MANTIGTSTLSETWRIKYLKNTLEIALRNSLVAEAICQVDRSELKYIANPYVSQPTATVQAVAGTYSVSTFTTTDDTLTVADEVVYSEQVFGFEEIMSRFDLYSARVDDMTYAIASRIDQWVLNEMVANAGTTYSTPAGGFTTAANWLTIMGALLSKVAGYSEAYKGTFVVVENTDLAGIIPAMGSNGFNMADSALRNGFVNNYMGVDIYVVRSGTFKTAATTTASGTKTWTNSGHRLFGVKGIATYAAPRGVQVEEKMVTGKTGKEIAVYGLIGAKVWTPKAALIVDITIV